MFRSLIYTILLASSSLGLCDHNNLGEVLNSLAFSQSAEDGREYEVILARTTVAGGSIDMEPIRSKVLWLLRSPEAWKRRGVLRLLGRGNYRDEEILREIDLIYDRDTEVDVYAAALKASCRKIIPLTKVLPRLNEAFSMDDLAIANSAIAVMESRRPDFNRDNLTVVFADQDLSTPIRHLALAYMIENGTRLHAGALLLAVEIAQEEDKDFFLQTLAKQTIRENPVNVTKLLQALKTLTHQPGVPSWTTEISAVVKKLPRTGGKPLTQTSGASSGDPGCIQKIAGHGVSFDTPEAAPEYYSPPPRRPGRKW